MKLKQKRYIIGNIGKRRFSLNLHQGDTKTTYIPTICSFTNDFRPPILDYVGEYFSRKHINVGLVWIQWWVGLEISIK